MKFFNWLFNEPAEDEYNLSGCQHAQTVAGKYGYQVTCPEDPEVLVQPISDPACAQAQKVASKHGYTIVCPE